MARYLRLYALVVSSVVLLAPAVAWACPDCESARIVRAAIIDEFFWRRLFLLSLPLLVLGIVSALLYRIGLHEPPTSTTLGPSDPERS